MNAKKLFNEIVNSSQLREILKNEKYLILSRRIISDLLNAAIQKAGSEDRIIILNIFKEKADEYIKGLKTNESELIKYLNNYINTKLSYIDNLYYLKAKQYLLSLKKVFIIIDVEFSKNILLQLLSNSLFKQIIEFIDKNNESENEDEFITSVLNNYRELQNQKESISKQTSDTIEPKKEDNAAKTAEN